MLGLIFLWVVLVIFCVALQDNTEYVKLSVFNLIKIEVAYDISKTGKE